MSESTEAPTEKVEEKSEASTRTREEIEEETGGVVETEHGKRYRIQIISNSGDEPSTI
ncbi:hypothetical protein MUK72_15140 (plasmid) [Halococcus dombrowskii]|uniref:Uncharacterized protein n=1 Tax=Halococcus dombrowskii TaxID=179637 RepID=A0AAV3SCG6_HALDO|nr:hypothetical protein [Halococcus dombrowskii]UOO96854.1 hypothetical protein MUK72_15140 [Halococcus dombrowskii]